jgi:hypothetical protein
MTEDIRESSVQVAVDIDLGDLDMRAMCALDQFLGSFATRLDNLFGVASQEDLANGLLVV